MLCPKCGNDLPKNTFICDKCGSEVSNYEFDYLSTIAKTPQKPIIKQNNQEHPVFRSKKAYGLIVPTIVMSILVWIGCYFWISEKSWDSPQAYSIAKQAANVCALVLSGVSLYNILCSMTRSRWFIVIKGILVFAVLAVEVYYNMEVIKNSFVKFLDNYADYTGISRKIEMLFGMWILFLLLWYFIDAAQCILLSDMKTGVILSTVFGCIPLIIGIAYIYLRMDTYSESWNQFGEYYAYLGFIVGNVLCSAARAKTKINPPNV